MLTDLKVVVRGGGDVGTGVAHRLHRAGMRLMVTEIPNPLVIRRTVAFASAIYDGAIEVEGVKARRASSLKEALSVQEGGEVPVLLDPEGKVIGLWRPQVVVDAIMAKRNMGTTKDQAPLVIGLGPGFEAGVDVHAVVETERGHYLGRVIYSGRARPDTGVPEAVEGHTRDRVLRAPASGAFHSIRKIGDLVEAGAVVGYVGTQEVRTLIAGVVRGLLADEVEMREGMKLGDVDPRGVVEYCFTISDRARAIGGGVLEAILHLGKQKAIL